MPHSYRDLFEVHLKYLDYVRSRSLLVHQYFQNISTTGSSVEVELRGILRQMLPSRFKVTHGYIVAAPSHATEPTVSPQVDIIIVDTLVAHSLFMVDAPQGMELVPVEAVVGVIEVKRTLTAASLSDAVAHLREIQDAASISKTDRTRYSPGGGIVGSSLTGGYYANPLVGIIALDDDAAFMGSPGAAVVEALAAMAAPPELDIVGVLSGTMVVTGQPGGPSHVWIANPREAGVGYPWTEIKVQRPSDARTGMAKVPRIRPGLHCRVLRKGRTCE